MSRYTVDTRAKIIMKYGVSMSIVEVVNELRGFEDLLESAGELIDQEFSPDDVSGPLNTIRRFLRNYNPKTEAELLEERLKAAEKLLLAYERQWGQTGLTVEYRNATAAHEAAKS